MAPPGGVALTYRLVAGVPADTDVRRVLLGQNRKALQLLEDWASDPAGRVHRARQQFKRQRALLRLIRGAVPYVYTVENRFYRDLARSLAFARDATAMVEAADLLLESLWAPLPRQSLVALREGLARRAADETARAAAGIAAPIGAACAALRDAERRLAAAPLEGLRRRDLRRGARRTRRAGARGFAAACATDDPEPFHEWRKHVKYAYYQARLLEGVFPAGTPREPALLCELGEILGRHQDLCVLGTLLAAQPDTLGIDLHLRRLKRLVATAQREHRQHARVVGAEVYAARAAAAGPRAEEL